MRKITAVAAMVVVASLAIGSTTLMAAPTHGSAVAMDRSASPTIFQSFSNLLAELMGKAPAGKSDQAPGKTVVRPTNDDSSQSTEGAIWVGLCRFRCY